MPSGVSVNDLVIRFSNVNGTGSASANGIFAKTLFRMGLAISPKNIFPSNIQGLPTWYEIRVSDKGYLGRKDKIDILVGVNPQVLQRDIDSIAIGGYFIYDSSKKLHDSFIRSDINYIGIPMMKIAKENYGNPRLQQLLKNIIYVGALATLLDMDFTVLEGVIRDQFSAKPKLIDSNLEALGLGKKFIEENRDFPLPVRIEKRPLQKDKILVDGNTATALGLIYGGATVAAWYPITPSTSIAKAFETYCKKLRKDPETGKSKYAIVQAEDELAAIGMVIGATWNGARAFTATSGAGVSLMNEFIGLSYFAEIPVTLINVQRGGPSTGMPTRTQQADVMSCAYASHGDTKHPLLFPSNPTECFHMAALCLDLADRLQTIVILMSDLDLGMNEHMTDEFTWDSDSIYDRGKVLSADELEDIDRYGRYLDVDGDGIPYRTIPGTHPTKGGFFTRGTSRDEYARYSELGEVYVRNVDRLSKKWQTIRHLVPPAEFYQKKYQSKIGLIFYGTTTYAAVEAIDSIASEGIKIDSMRLKAFPFGQEVVDFISDHDEIFVVEQNKDGQMRTLLINELDIDPAKLLSILNYDGMPITSDHIAEDIRKIVYKNSYIA